MLCNEEMKFINNIEPGDMTEPMYNAWKRGVIPIPGCGRSIRLVDLLDVIDGAMTRTTDPTVISLVTAGTNPSPKEDDFRLSVKEYCKPISFAEISECFRIYCYAWIKPGHENSPHENIPAEIKVIYVFDYKDMENWCCNADSAIRDDLTKYLAAQYSDIAGVGWCGIATLGRFESMVEEHLYPYVE